MKKKKEKLFGEVFLLPIVGGNLTKEKLKEIKDNIAKYGIQPRNMVYRKEFMKGRGASTKDKTWNKEKHIHTCCKSKAPWRHKVLCKTL